MSRLPGRRKALSACVTAAAGMLGAGVAGAAQPGAAAAPAKAARRLLLWPAGLPEAAPAGLQQTFVQRSAVANVSDRSLQGVTAPFLDVYVPNGRATGSAIVLCPGGGYRYMAWDKEGEDLARWFAARGVLAAVLAYRLPLDGWNSGLDAPLADLQRAVRVLRQQASELALDPQRVAVMGFSAGGHLVTNLGASFARQVYAPRDAADALSARPALVGGLYVAVKLDEIGRELLGPATPSQVLALHSPHLQVGADAPPHFLLHAEDDPLVDPSHALALRAALRSRGVAVETHLHAKGGHGFGIRNTQGLPVDGWPDRFMVFGRSTGWLPA